MDRACVRRARRLREKVGYVDQASTLKDFTAYVEKTANEAGGPSRPSPSAGLGRAPASF